MKDIFVAFPEQETERKIINGIRASFCNSTNRL